MILHFTASDISRQHKELKYFTQYDKGFHPLMRKKKRQSDESKAEKNMSGTQNKLI